MRIWPIRRTLGFLGLFDQLPQRALVFEMLVRQGLDAQVNVSLGERIRSESNHSPGPYDQSTSQTYETFEEVQK
jgi:hypothetical protein